ncbi:helix-turn-helix domain-containing protein [Gilvimarinus agarilyticus]|uniref:helix-turn-helix domain-containing protein n=1 Tax=Gilvimarinus agarilyticus TaxID=679259 RepID=UPI0005A0D9FA|nr:AraC family transcriptional regulator [Gilvimarinus agarilyticus]
MSHIDTPQLDHNQLLKQIVRISPEHRLQTEQNRGPVLEGHIDFRAIGPDLSIHCVDATELCNSRSTGDCKPGLSVNILLAGEVQFALGADRYSVAADQQPIGLALAVNKAEPFTRFLQAGQCVRKVNISVSFTWLESRLSGEQISQLFQRRVFTWAPDAEQTATATRLLTLSRQAGPRLLQQESDAIQLLAAVTARGVLGAETVPVKAHRAEQDILQQQILPLLQGECDLAALAQRLGMSVSTLQRRFKAVHGVTVMEYARAQRLEASRRALLVDGVSVKAAAYMAGYEHPSNFISAFKREFLVTPAALVRTHLNVSDD